MKLIIEAIPQPFWPIYVRLNLTPTEWTKLRRACFARAGHRCEVCRAGPIAGLWCHGVWEYDDEHGIQKLIGSVALCSACHEVKHYARVFMTERELQAQRHFLKINGCTPAEMHAHIVEARARTVQRAERKWVVDLSWFDQFREQRQFDDAQ